VDVGHVQAFVPVSRFKRETETEIHARPLPYGRMDNPLSAKRMCTPIVSCSHLPLFVVCPPFRYNATTRFSFVDAPIPSKSIPTNDPEPS
jgi:hypothetical protein